MCYWYRNKTFFNYNPGCDLIVSTSVFTIYSISLPNIVTCVELVELYIDYFGMVLQVLKDTNYFLSIAIFNFG